MSDERDVSSEWNPRFSASRSFRRCTLQSGWYSPTYALRLFVEDNKSSLLGLGRMGKQRRGSRCEIYAWHAIDACRWLELSRFCVSPFTRAVYPLKAGIINGDRTWENNASLLARVALDRCPGRIAVSISKCYYCTGLRLGGREKRPRHADSKISKIARDIHSALSCVVPAP